MTWPDPAAESRRLAEVFGEVLPETGRDDIDPGDEPDAERWYAENRPPHHEPS